MRFIMILPDWRAERRAQSYEIRLNYFRHSGAGQLRAPESSNKLNASIWIPGSGGPGMTASISWKRYHANHATSPIVTQQKWPGAFWARPSPARLYRASALRHATR
jgi:hypothetical protein